MRALIIVFAYFVVGCWTDGDVADGNDPGFNPETDMQFLLYTQRNPVTPQIISPVNWTSIEVSNFNASIPTRVYAHGWQADVGYAALVAEGYLQRGNHQLNFIYANWYKGASTLNYTLARERVNVVGPFISRLINLLVERANLKLSDVHIIGHSLGAHVAGMAGKNIENGKVKKIVGLDPAKQLFQYNLTELRLHFSDAHYVESIHSNGGRIGIFETIGQSSFYPNGGRSQPGCSADGCAHARAFHYFHESLFSSVGFYGEWCSSLDALDNGTCESGSRSAIMCGEPGNLENVDGIYFLRTNDRAPFAQGRP